MAPIYNPSIQKAEAGGLPRLQRKLWLYSEF